MVYQVIIGNDGRPMHVPGARVGRGAAAPEDGRPVWGGGGGARRNKRGGGGGEGGSGSGGGDYHGYARREPTWEFNHHRSAAINRLAEPKRDYSDERAEQRPAWGARGGGGTTVRQRRGGYQQQQPMPRMPRSGGYHAPEPEREPRFGGGGGGRKSSKKFPPLQRVHGMSRLDALRQQQEVQQDQLRCVPTTRCPTGVLRAPTAADPCAICVSRDLREQQREQQRQLATQQEAELEELHSMQAWQQQLQEKLANLEEQTMVTAEAILDEIEDARADVRNVTKKSLRSLTTKRRQELQQQKQPSPRRGRDMSPKRPSPVFTPDDEEERDRAPSPASARTRRAVKKVQPDGLREGATLAERRKWVEEMDTATLEASMDDLLEEVNHLRKDVDAGVSGKQHGPGQRGAAAGGGGKRSPKRDSRRRSPERARDHRRAQSGLNSRAEQHDPDDRDELQSPPVAVLPQVAANNYKSPARAKGSIIGELRRAGLSVGLPDQAKSAANSRAYDMAPPALRPAAEDQEELSHHRGGRERRGRSESPHRRRDGGSEEDDIAAAVEEEERREIEAAAQAQAQAAADQLYAEMDDALAEPWVEKVAGPGGSRKKGSKKASSADEGRHSSRSVAKEEREKQSRKKKPHGQIRSSSGSRRGRGGQHSPKRDRIAKLPSLPSVSESFEEEGDEDEAEKRRFKQALAAGNVDDIQATLVKGGGGGGGGTVLAKARGGSRDEQQPPPQPLSATSSATSSGSATSPMTLADPKKMRALQDEAITHKEYVEMSLENTGWGRSEPEPSFMRPVEKKSKKSKKKQHNDDAPSAAYEEEIAHVQEVLSRSSKLRMLRDQKAAAKRDRRAGANVQAAAENAAVSYVRAATG
jgi:hypothetical protein